MFTRKQAKSRRNHSCQPQTADSPSTPLLDANDLARLLRCSVRHVRKLTDTGRIPAIRAGRLVRFRAEDVIESLS